MTRPSHLHDDGAKVVCATGTEGKSGAYRGGCTKQLSTSACQGPWWCVAAPLDSKLRCSGPLSLRRLQSCSGYLQRSGPGTRSHPELQNAQSSFCFPGPHQTQPQTPGPYIPLRTLAPVTLGSLESKCNGENATADQQSCCILISALCWNSMIAVNGTLLDQNDPGTPVRHRMVCYNHD